MKKVFLILLVFIPVMFMYSQDTNINNDENSKQITEMESEDYNIKIKGSEITDKTESASANYKLNTKPYNYKDYVSYNFV